MDACSESRLARWGRWTGRGSGVAAILWLVLPVMAGVGRPEQDGLLGAFVMLVCLAAAIRTARRLPWQNVVAAFGVLWATESVALMVAASLGWPGVSGRYIGGEVGFRFHDTPWLQAFLGAGLVLASREAGRWLLRSRAGGANYGFQLLAVTMLLAAVGCFNGPCDAEAASRGGSGVGAWLVARGASFFGTFLLAGVMSIAATPWLISKRPIATPPDRAALAGWLVIPVTFLLADCLQGRWIAVGTGGLHLILIAALAWRTGCDSAGEADSRIAMPGSVAG